jgi:hypothetical protein
MSRPPLPEGLVVYIESYDPQGKASYLSGYFEVKQQRLKFDGIMMDEYGGPNVLATLSDETLAALRHLGLDLDAIDELITALQLKIMQGEIHVQLREEQSKPPPDETH